MGQKILGGVLIVAATVSQLAAYGRSYLTGNEPAYCLVLPTAWCRRVLASGYAGIAEDSGLGALLDGRTLATLTPALPVVAVAAAVAGLVLLVRKGTKS